MDISILQALTFCITIDTVFYNGIYEEYYQEKQAVSKGIGQVLGYLRGNLMLFIGQTPAQCDIIVCASLKQHHTATLEAVC